MILKNNSEDVKVLVRYFESLSIESRLKLSIYKDNMDVFILAKVKEMNEKEKLNLVFEIIYII